MTASGAIRCASGEGCGDRDRCRQRRAILHRHRTVSARDRVCIKLLTPASLCDLSFVCLIQTGPTAGPRHHRIRSARNFSTRHCSLRPTPHMTQYWQAAACPRAAQQKRRRTEVSVPHSGSPGTVGRHNNTPKRVCIRCVCHKHPPHPRPRAACGARLLIERRKPFKFLQGIQ